MRSLDSRPATRPDTPTNVHENKTPLVNTTACLHCATPALTVGLEAWVLDLAVVTGRVGARSSDGVGEVGQPLVLLLLRARRHQQRAVPTVDGETVGHVHLLVSLHHLRRHVIV